MDKVENKFEIDNKIEIVQEEIRNKTAFLFEVIDEEEKQIIQSELEKLRRKRQILFDEKLNLQRTKLIKREKETEKEKQEEATSENLSHSTEEKIQLGEKYTKKQTKKDSSTPPSWGIRLLTLVLVFSGVAFITISVMNFAINSLEPPPIEGLSDNSTENSNSGSNENLTLEQRALALYLALNREKIERPVSDNPTPIIFHIEEGDTALTIAQKLQTEGLIENAELFRRLLRYRGVDTSLEVGVFELAANMTMDQIITVLQDGKLEEITFTFPEGWRATQMAALLEEQNLTTAAEYMALVNQPSHFDYDFLRSLPANSTLEGYLFPDTYSIIPQESNAESLIRLQLENFGKRVTEELRQIAIQKQMTLHEAIILSSIVEREAVIAEERKIIAGVYINRWIDRTVLNADPTIQYALGYQKETGQWWKSPLTRQDLELDSPYNTYIQPGLPPSPIANPGLDAIQSTILAPHTPYYYFVSRNDGTHIFAVTFEEHLENVAQYQSDE